MGLRFGFLSIVLTTLLLCVTAQNEENITIWASAVYTRSGERTPLIEWLESNGEAPVLTSLGAYMAFTAGSQLRDRYMKTNQIDGLSRSTIRPEQLLVMALDQGQYGPASAQAFSQGLYPAANVTKQSASDNREYVLASKELLENPLHGYQYPWINSVGPNDPASIFVSGADYCPAFSTRNVKYMNRKNENSTKLNEFYYSIAKVLSDKQLPKELWGYWNAYKVFDYVNYKFAHDPKVRKLLVEGELAKSNTYNKLRYLSDQYNWGLYGKTSKENSIARMAGQTLALQIVAALDENISSAGLSKKLNILVGDFSPLISLFSLLSLEIQSTDFFGLPRWGSVAAFELFSTTPTTSSYPDPKDLRVRFLFRNGTTSSATLSTYPIFGSTTSSLSWQEFKQKMTRVSIGSIGNWCSRCDAWKSAVFCPFYNASLQAAIYGQDVQNIGSTDNAISPPLAGLVGACVTLGLLGVVFVVVVLGFGVRFTRVKRRRGNTKEIGGSRGFQEDRKMGSDVDSTIVEDGEDLSQAGVEQKNDSRMRSWELRNTNPGLNTDRDDILPSSPPPHPAPQRPLSFVSSVRESFDSRDPDENPFQSPIKAEEHV